MSEKTESNKSGSSLLKKANIVLSVFQNKETVGDMLKVANDAQTLLDQVGNIYHQGKAAIDDYNKRSRQSFIGKIFSVPEQKEKGVFKQPLILEFPFGDKSMSLLSSSTSMNHVETEKFVDFTLNNHAVTRTYSASLDESNILGKNGFQLNLYCQLIEKDGKMPYRALEITASIYNMNATQPDCLEKFHTVIQLTDAYEFDEYDTGNQKILLPRKIKRKFGVDTQNRLMLVLEIL